MASPSVTKCLINFGQLINGEKYMDTVDHYLKPETKHRLHQAYLTKDTGRISSFDETTVETLLQVHEYHVFEYLRHFSCRYTDLFRVHGELSERCIYLKVNVQQGLIKEGEQAVAHCCSESLRIVGLLMKINKRRISKLATRMQAVQEEVEELREAWGGYVDMVKDIHKATKTGETWGEWWFRHAEAHRARALVGTVKGEEAKKEDD